MDVSDCVMDTTDLEIYIMIQSSVMPGYFAEWASSNMVLSRCETKEDL